MKQRRPSVQVAVNTALARNGMKAANIYDRLGIPRSTYFNWMRFGNIPAQYLPMIDQILQFTDEEIQILLGRRKTK